MAFSSYFHHWTLLFPHLQGQALSLPREQSGSTHRVCLALLHGIGPQGPVAAPDCIMWPYSVQLSLPPLLTSGWDNESGEPGRVRRSSVSRVPSLLLQRCAVCVHNQSDVFVCLFSHVISSISLKGSEFQRTREASSYHVCLLLLHSCVCMVCEYGCACATVTHCACRDQKAPWWVISPSLFLWSRSWWGGWTQVIWFVH